MEKDTEGKTCWECLDKHLSIAGSNLREALADPNKREAKVKTILDSLIEGERHMEKNLDVVAKIRPIRKEFEQEYWGRGQAKITPEQIDRIREEIKIEGKRRSQLLGKAFVHFGEKLQGMLPLNPKPKPVLEPEPPEPSESEVQRYYALRAQAQRNNIDKPPVRRLIDGIRPNFIDVIRPYKRRYRNV